MSSSLVLSPLSLSHVPHSREDPSGGGGCPSTLQIAIRFSTSTHTHTKSSTRLEIGRRLDSGCVRASCSAGRAQHLVKCGAFFELEERAQRGRPNGLQLVARDAFHLQIIAPVSPPSITWRSCWCPMEKWTQRSAGSLAGCWKDPRERSSRATRHHGDRDLGSNDCTAGGGWAREFRSCHVTWPATLSDLVVVPQPVSGFQMLLSSNRTTRAESKTHQAFPPFLSTLDASGERVLFSKVGSSKRLPCELHSTWMITAVSVISTEVGGSWSEAADIAIYPLSIGGEDAMGPALMSVPTRCA